mgnify:CR=1 FL=1
MIFGIPIGKSEICKIQDFTIGNGVTQCVKSGRSGLNRESWHVCVTVTEDIYSKIVHSIQRKKKIKL